MRLQLEKFVLVGLVVVFLCPDPADAWFGRRRRSNYTTYSSEPETQEEAKPAVGVIREKSNNSRTEYDYNWAARREWTRPDAPQWLFPNKVRVKLWLRDDLAKKPDELKFQVHWNYLHRTKKLNETWTELQKVGDHVFLDVDGIEEGRPVKLVIDIYQQSTEQTASTEVKVQQTSVKRPDGTFEYVGRIHTPYYGVTTSKENEEFKRRAQIVSFSFSQWYVDEAYGGRFCGYDCSSFYQTSATGEMNGFTFTPVSHSEVVEKSKKGDRFHGDHLIMPGHYGMALCYDEDTDNFCTIEGNYALNGPYRINIDPDYHGLYTWSSIQHIAKVDKQESTAN